MTARLPVNLDLQQLYLSWQHRECNGGEPESGASHRVKAELEPEGRIAGSVRLEPLSGSANEEEKTMMMNS